MDKYGLLNTCQNETTDFGTLNWPQIEDVINSQYRICNNFCHQDELNISPRHELRQNVPEYSHRNEPKYGHRNDQEIAKTDRIRREMANRAYKATVKKKYD